jgi:hypothetical protein
MFVITEDKSIYLTRGDSVVIDVSAKISLEENYIFTKTDVVAFRVMQKGKCEEIVLEKEILVEQNTEMVTFELTKEDTKLGEIINKPKDYWYEIELNPETDPKTIIGYDEKGPKIFRIYPEGGE